MEEFKMDNPSGRQGELLFAQKMAARGLSIEDVSNNPFFFDKDIDFFVTNPSTGATRSVEVKWDARIASTHNLYLEILNRNSKQWNGGGWYKHCQADFVAYGDANNHLFYFIPM
jgi:hypothetical protein